MRLLRPNELRVGKPLRWPLYDRSGLLLLQGGRVIESHSQLEILLERGCLVSEADTRSVRNAASLAAAPAPPPELKTPFEAMDALKLDIGVLHRQLLSGTASGVAERVARMAADMDYAFARDTDAVLASMQLQLDPNDHAARQTHAAILCVFAARMLRLDDGAMRGLTGAALTYDVALGPLASELNSQSERLDSAQLEQIQAHPETAFRLLQDAGIEDPVWLHAVLHHHERLDGSGYPRGLRGEDIPCPTRLLAIVDTYTAMLRPRTYRDAMPARMALRSIFLERGKLVDEALAAALIKELGIYPPGTLVRLANDEIGIVVRRGEDATHPLVSRLMTAEGYRASVTVARDTREPEFQIVDAVPHERYPGLVGNAETFWK